MKTYRLMMTEDYDMELENFSPMYPTKLEEKINNLAGRKITKPANPTIFGITNTFRINFYEIDFFVNEVLPHLGYKLEENNNVIWDKDEEVFEI